LDDEQLALFGIGGLAVGQLAGQAGTTHEALAASGGVSSLACGQPGHGRALRLARDQLAFGGILLEPGAELLVDDPLNEALRLGVAELGLRLPLELRLSERSEEHTSELQ